MLLAFYQRDIKIFALIRIVRVDICSVEAIIKQFVSLGSKESFCLSFIRGRKDQR